MVLLCLYYRPARKDKNKEQREEERGKRNGNEKRSYDGFDLDGFQWALPNDETKNGNGGRKGNPGVFTRVRISMFVCLFACFVVSSFISNRYA